METKTATATAATAYGQPINPPLKYDYSWEIYTSKDELVAAKDELTLDEQVKVRNSEHQTAARQKAQQAAYDAAGIVKPTIETDDQLRLREFFKILMSSKKYSEQEARTLAAGTLGIDWAE